MKKLLALILSIIMAISIIPAFIVGTSAGIESPMVLTIAETKEEFFAALRDPTSNYIELRCDIEITNTDYNNQYYLVIKGYDRTIDLDNHTITISKNVGGEYGFITRVLDDNRSLTFFNGTIINKSSSFTFLFAGGLDKNKNFKFILDTVNITAGNSTLIYADSYVTNTSLFVDNVNINVPSSNSFYLCASFDTMNFKDLIITREKSYTFVSLSTSTKLFNDCIPKGYALKFDDAYVDTTDKEIKSLVLGTSMTELQLSIVEKSLYPEPYYVSTVAELLKAATIPEVKTIKLSTNITCSNDIQFYINGTNKVLDLNNKTLFVLDPALIYLNYQSNHTFTITDSSTGGGGGINATSRSINVYSIINIECKFSVTSEVIINKGKFVTDSTSLINDIKNSKIIINGGEFYSYLNIVRLNYSDYSKLVLNGFSFKLLTNDSRDNMAISSNRESDQLVKNYIGNSAKLYYIDGDGKVTEVTDNKLGTIYKGNGNLVLTTIDLLNTSTSKKGDINGDNKVNAVDANLMEQIIVGKISMNDAADIDGDNKVNSVDASLMISLITG